MHAFISSRKRLPRTFFLLGLVIVSSLLLGDWATCEIAAQSGNGDRTPENKSPVPVSGQTKNKKKKAEVEEGDEPVMKRPKPKVPKRQEVEESDLKPDETQAVDLAAEAKNAQGEIRAFFTSLAEPHDDIVMRGGRIDHVEPLPQYIGPAPSFSGTFKPTRIEKSGKHTLLRFPIGKRDIRAVYHFEQLTLAKVKVFLEKKDGPRLLAAEKALIFAIRFHVSTRVRNPDDAKKWEVVENSLRDKLLDVRLDHVSALGSTHQYSEAFDLAEQLAKEHPSSRPVQFQRARLALDQAQDSGQVEDYVAARRMYLAFADQFPDSRKADSLRKGLVAAAEKLAHEAKDLASKDPAAAVILLRKAGRIWPQLPTLQEKLHSLDQDHPILYVGVKELPKYLSPAMACTNTEKQAVELLFEGLVKSSGSEGPGGWQDHTPALAEGRPRIFPLGREFHLAKDAFWSDGKRVIAADIRHTVSLLKMPKLPGRNTAWAKLVEDPRVQGNPFRIRLALRIGFIDPLSLMTFKVLPRQVRGKTLSQADDEQFALNPVGSGPFQYQETAIKGGTQYAVFTANPFYQRSGRKGRPRIREIRFFVCHNLKQDFDNSRLDVLLDLPTARIKEAQQAGFKEDIRTLSNRRVYFLAVNHSNEYLQNQDLRKAIAHAINREAILKAHFRAGYLAVDRDQHLRETLANDTEKLHPALNGPYPAGSWACSPSVPAKLFELDRAQTKGERALAKFKTVPLTLKYPNDDSRVEKACQDICEQVKKAFNNRIQLTAEGLPPHTFQQAINKRQYDLAYGHYDYASDAYWLWPLFDPEKNARDPGGSNFLRYHNDSDLESMFRKAMTTRNLNEVKKLTHDIHAHLYEKMPLIPLWQLHTHLAFHPRVTPVGVDPLRVFSSAEGWKLDRK